MKEKYHVIVICNHEFDYFREVIDYDCDYIVFSMNVIDYDYEFAIVIVIVPTIAITDYDYPMPAWHTSWRHDVITYFCLSYTFWHIPFKGSMSHGEQITTQYYHIHISGEHLLRVGT